MLCGDATRAEDVARLLGERKPILMVTDPPYGIELDSEWRDRAGLNTAPGQKRTAASKAAAKANPQYPAEASYMKHRTEGHTETTISGDTRADWSEAFELVPSLQIAYVWHASKFTREVLDGLLRIGFLHHQQIIWDKGRTVLTRTLYWFQHEPCWFVRKKNAPWYGKAGENSTIWASPSPKFIMGGSDEEKYDHCDGRPRGGCKHSDRRFGRAGAGNGQPVRVPPRELICGLAEYTHAATGFRHPVDARPIGVRNSAFGSGGLRSYGAALRQTSIPASRMPD